jgi:hypothetical protein
MKLWRSSYENICLNITSGVEQTPLLKLRCRSLNLSIFLRRRGSVIRKGVFFVNTEFSTLVAQNKHLYSLIHIIRKLYHQYHPHTLAIEHRWCKNISASPLMLRFFHCQLILLLTKGTANCNLMYILSTIITKIQKHTFGILFSFFSIDSCIYQKLIIDRRPYIERAFTVYCKLINKCLLGYWNIFCSVSSEERLLIMYKSFMFCR